MIRDIVSEAQSKLNPCTVCPRGCGADRLAGEAGFCGVARRAKVASAGSHFGEESVLVGEGGSGTIFFQGCNLACVFCQNYDISQSPGGAEMSAGDLAGLMLKLQGDSCENVNLVSPSHVAPQALEAVARARQAGLHVPVVYNCGGYESVEMLGLLEGQVDIYMPDFKYADSRAGLKYSGVPDYEPVARAALAEMYGQVGPMEVDVRGVAVRGVLVRHLVMPLDLASSENVVEIVAETAPGCAINVMGQYRPSFRASDYPELLELPDASEVARLRRCAARLGLRRVD